MTMRKIFIELGSFQKKLSYCFLINGIIVPVVWYILELMGTDYHTTIRLLCCQDDVVLHTEPDTAKKSQPQPSPHPHSKSSNLGNFLAYRHLVDQITSEAVCEVCASGGWRKVLAFQKDRRFGIVKS